MQEVSFLKTVKHQANEYGMANRYYFILSTIRPIFQPFNSVLWKKKKISTGRIQGWSEFQGNLLISGVGNYMYSRPSCSYSPSTASSWPPDTRGPHFQVPNGEGLFCDLLENRCSPRAKREVLLGEEKGFCSSE